ncbi:MAG: Holliday junction branch migration protein RuvA [Patescibacteria group bacterium]
MIAKIKGTLTEFVGQEGFIETPTGVTYRLFLPASYRSLTLPVAVDVYTYLHVREDAMILFGFDSRVDMDLFSLFHSVSGVGPKTAYAILAFVDVEGITQAVTNNDVNYFTRIPGLGKKTSLKILLELSQKMKQTFIIPSEESDEQDSTLYDALLSLGFASKDIHNVTNKIDKEQTLEEQLKEGIRLLTTKK